LTFVDKLATEKVPKSFYAKNLHEKSKISKTRIFISNISTP